MDMTVQSAVAVLVDDSPYSAEAALVDMTVRRVKWRFLWIWQFIDCNGGSCGYDSS